MKKLSGLLCALALSGAFPFAATAQIADVDTSSFSAPDSGDDDSGGFTTPDRRMYVAPMFSYALVDKDRETDDGMGGTIAVGKRFTSGLNLELTGFYNSMDWGSQAAEGTFDLSGIGVGAMIFPSRAFPEVYGFVGLYMGQGEGHPTVPPSNDFSYKTTVFTPGVGYLMPLAEFLGGYEMSLRAEALYRHDAHTREVAGIGGQKSFSDYVFNVGLHIPLGTLPVEQAAADVEVVEPAGPVDADGDGVTDDVDQCPDTPAGTPVNEQGCEGDTDADGVPDGTDSCPDTPAGTAVNEQGCHAAVDSDGDGVPDDRDQCPDTPAGSEVDENGCPPQTGCRAPAPGEPISLEGCATGESIVLKGVTFDLNSSRLTANARVILNQVADSLAAEKDVRVEIGGHTDSTGSDAYNQKLSERRALSVKDYLVARGIDSGRLAVKGYGESVPIDSNETPEGREQNRRVELKVIDTGSP
jgi:OmpA-OmpF porin, OOP family